MRTTQLTDSKTKFVSSDQLISDGLNAHQVEKFIKKREHKHLKQGKDQILHHEYG